MKKALKILSLEDSTTDLEIIKETLEDYQLSAVVTNVKNRTAFIDILSKEEFDLFFIDFMLPGFTGLDAVKEIRKRNIEQPIIIISGTIGDELAIECIKAGATDYVLKNHMQRLITAINRALQEYETREKKKLAEAELTEYSHKLELLNQELLEKNRALDEANKKLQSLDAMKSEFIALASHEFRTPLTSIMGFTQTLLSEDLKLVDADRIQYLHVIDNESKRLSYLLNTLLDISNIERGALTLTKEVFNICKVIREVENTEHIPETVVLQIQPPDCSVRVFADRARIKQVIKNILENALQNTSRHGTITIMVFSNEHETHLAINNTGPVIPEDELEKIFSKFYRIRRPIRESSGSGMGLAVAREIIQLHGGKIWAESSSEQGTTFHFTIPVIY